MEIARPLPRPRITGRSEEEEDEEEVDEGFDEDEDTEVVSDIVACGGEARKSRIEAVSDSCDCDFKKASSKD